MFKNKLHTFVALCLALTFLTLAMVCGGCSAAIPNPVVAKIGDVEVTYSSFYQQFELYASYGLIDTSTPESLAEGRKLVFDMLVSSALPVAEAHREGFTLTEDELTAARQKGRDAADNYYLEDFMNSSIEDENARREAAINQFNAAYKSQHYQYKDILAEFEDEYINNALRDKFVATLYTDIPETTDEEAKAWYDENLPEEQEAYAADPAAYYDAVESYAYSGDVRPLEAPEGLFYVKHILIKSKNEDGEAQDVNAKVDEVLQKILDGQDFNALIDEYNQDTNMTSMAVGNIMGEGLQDKYGEEYYNAAVALGKDDVTTLDFGDSGVYIIKRVDDVNTATVVYEDVAAEIKDKLFNDKKSAAYDAAQQEWKASNEVKLYEQRVKYVGVSK